MTLEELQDIAFRLNDSTLNQEKASVNQVREIAKALSVDALVRENERLRGLLDAYRPQYAARRIVQSPNDGRGTRSVAMEAL